MKWLMFNSMFAPPASVEFASKLIANFTSNALSGEDCLCCLPQYAELRAGFN
jgi:hypothetical protein